MNLKKWIVIQVLLFNLGLVMVLAKPEKDVVVHRPQPVAPVAPVPEQPPEINPQISTPFPDYLNYEQTVARLKKWHEEAPELTEMGVYGKSSRGQDLYYIKIRNEYIVPDKHWEKKPSVLITACIHGNEPLSASTVMCYIGTLLDRYGEDEQITQLIDTRDIYFIPVVSPDSYPGSRHVDGVDPNRNFPTQRDPDKRSVPPVQALREFFLQIKPNAVISGHTHGRVYLHPWGDQTRTCPNHEDFQRIIGEMGRLSQYRVIRACQMYGRPIYGTEVDWYYRNGAMAVVMEFGTHQRVPSPGDIRTEFDRTFKAVLHFIEEAPKVEVQLYSVEPWRKAA